VTQRRRQFSHHEWSYHYWNRGAEALYGWTAEQAKGKLARELLKTLSAVPRDRIMAELVRSGRWEGELGRTKKDGTQVVVASRWSLQMDARGTPVAALETDNDITDRKRAEEERERLRQLEADLARINRVSMHDAANRQSITFRTDLDAALPTTMADRVQVQQVLMNLMLNGIEAMRDERGELSITSTRTDDDQLLISVSDSGGGLPEEEPDRIFEAFFTTKPQGTGMGLSISRRIIESLGGRLWASPNTGRAVHSPERADGLLT